MSILERGICMECKNCGCEEFYTEQKGPHLGIYCKACNQWQKWGKQSDLVKTKEEYKHEYMSNQPATPEQKVFLKRLGYVGEVKNRSHATRIIEAIKCGDAS